MSVPKGRQRPSRFEANHHFYKLRREVTTLALLDFGFSEDKYRKTIDWYRECHRSAEDVDKVVANYEKKCESFNRHFIDRESDKVLDLISQISYEFTLGNSIYPSDTPAKLVEFVVRRLHMNRAIGLCYALKQEINFVLETLPVNIDKAERFDDAINEQIRLYKGVRQADNRFLKKKKERNDKILTELADAIETVSSIARRIGMMEIKK